MQGNRDAFAVLVDRTHPRLVGTAGLILRDPGWAEDAAQDALVRAWRDLPSLRDPDRFDACRLVEPPGELLVEDRDQLERGLRHLTDQQRTIIALRYYLGLTDAEVAAATGLPIGTVKSRIFRALESLRAALAAEARGASVQPAHGTGEGMP